MGAWTDWKRNKGGPLRIPCLERRAEPAGSDLDDMVPTSITFTDACVFHNRAVLQQPNCNDCGVHTLMNAALISQNSTHFLADANTLQVFEMVWCSFLLSIAGVIAAMIM